MHIMLALLFLAHIQHNKLQIERGKESKEWRRAMCVEGQGAQSILSQVAASARGLFKPRFFPASCQNSLMARAEHISQGNYFATFEKLTVRSQGK